MRLSVLLLFLLTCNLMAMQEESHYEILGVNRDASPGEIRKAYLNLALKWHPDRWSKQSKKEQLEAETKFKKISDAYSVLNDAEKRREYDNPIDLRNVKDAAEISKIFNQIERWHTKYPYETIYEALEVQKDATVEEVEASYQKLIKDKSLEVVEKLKLARYLLQDLSARNLYNMGIRSDVRKKIRTWLKSYPNESPYDFLKIVPGATNEQIKKQYAKLHAHYENTFKSKKDGDTILNKLQLAAYIAKQDDDNLFEKILLEKRKQEQHADIKKLLEKIKNTRSLSDKSSLINSLLQETKKWNFNENASIDPERPALREVWNTLLKDQILRAFEETINDSLKYLTLKDIPNVKKLIKKAQKKYRRWKTSDLDSLKEENYSNIFNRHEDIFNKKKFALEKSGLESKKRGKAPNKKVRSKAN